MNVGIKHFSRLAFLTIALSLLAGCVTEVTGGSPMKAAPRDDQVKSLVDLGIGYIRNGEYARAKDNLTRALSMDPNSAIVHNAFGLVYQLEGEVKLSEANFQKAIRDDPKYTAARNNYAGFLFQQERYEDAVKELLIASNDSVYARRSTVFENLGVAYLKLNKHAEAERAFVRATQLNPAQGRALLELAEIKYKQGSYSEAREYYKRHMAVAGPSARNLLFCVKISRIFGAENDEASCALSLRNIFPNSPEYREFQAMGKK